MDDLISRTLALEVISAVKGITWSQSGQVLCGKMYSRIKDLPAVNAAPVTHAEWVYDPDGMDWNLGAWKCSKCHCRNDNLPGNLPKTNPYRWAGSKYCPNCGAKMGKADV